MKPFIGQATALALGALISAGLSGAGAADKPYEGMTLNLASQNDQFAAVLAAIAPEFEALTGAKVNVDILSYPELLTKITADYVGHTKGYDLATVDIVWSGQFAEAGYTVDLTDWIKRDAAEIKVDDIYPVADGVARRLQGQAGRVSVRRLRQRARLSQGPLRSRRPQAAGDDGGIRRRRAQADRQAQEDLRLRRQRPEGPGGGAGLDAVQSPVRRLDPRQGRQAGAEFAPPTSRASSPTRNCSTRPRLPAPPTTIGAAARRASARGWLRTCRPGRSAPPTTTTRKYRRSPARRGSC